MHSNKKAAYKTGHFAGLYAAWGQIKEGKSNSVNVELAPKNERNGESVRTDNFHEKMQAYRCEREVLESSLRGKVSFNDWFHLMLHPSGVKIHHKRILG